MLDQNRATKQRRWLVPSSLQSGCREEGCPRPYLPLCVSADVAPDLGSLTPVGSLLCAPCPRPAGGRWGGGLARPPEPGVRCSEQSRPGASQTGKLHPRVTKQLSSSADE